MICKYPEDTVATETGCAMQSFCEVSTMPRFYGRVRRAVTYGPGGYHLLFPTPFLPSYDKGVSHTTSGIRKERLKESARGWDKSEDQI